MKCPICEKEMIEGTVLFMKANDSTPPFLTCSFDTNEESDDIFVKKSSRTKNLLGGIPVTAYRCSECDIVVPIIK